MTKPERRGEYRLGCVQFVHFSWKFYFYLAVVCCAQGCSSKGKDDQLAPGPGVILPITTSSEVVHVPKAYTELARLISEEHYQTRELPPNSSDGAYLRAKIQNTLLDLRQLETTDSDIRFIRDEAVQAVTDMMDTIDGLEKLPNPPDVITQISESVVLTLLGQTNTLVENDRAIAQQNAIVENGFKKIATSDRRLKTAVLMLHKIAAQYVNSETASTQLFDIDVDEAWPTADSAWLTLVNRSGRELHDCTISVKLANPDGNFVPHLHFVPVWTAEHPLYFNYDRGVQLGEERLGVGLPSRIEQVTVEVFSREVCQLGMRYYYSAIERDKDIAQDCQELIFTARFQDFKSGFFKSDLPAIMCKFTGMPRLPAGKAIITLPNGDSNTVGFNQWLEQVELEIQFLHLEQLPPQWELRMEFMGSDAICSRQFKH